MSKNTGARYEIAIDATFTMPAKCMYEQRPPAPPDAAPGCGSIFGLGRPSWCLTSPLRSGQSLIGIGVGVPPRRTVDFF
jgi:hypothetical protein